MRERYFHSGRKKKVYHPDELECDNSEYVSVKMTSHIGHICRVFLQCVFSRGASIHYLRKTFSYILCTRDLFVQHETYGDESDILSRRRFYRIENIQNALHLGHVFVHEF